MDQPDHMEVALSRLIHIFQQEKGLAPGDCLCDRLERIGGESRRRQTAHFCCELAEEANSRNELAEVKTWLLDALAAIRIVPIANLLLGNLAMWRATIRQRSRLFRRSSSRIAAIFRSDRAPRSVLRYTGHLDQWLTYRDVQQRDHGGRITDALAEWLLRQEGEEAALRFLERELREYPTLLGLRRLVEIKLGRDKGAEYTDLKALHCISTQMLNNAAVTAAITAVSSSSRCTGVAPVACSGARSNRYPTW